MSSAIPVPVEVVGPEPEAQPPVPGEPGRPLGWLRWSLGWIWRIVAGMLACFAGLGLLSYAVSILALGWLCRWTQGRILLGWWRQSPVRHRRSFERLTMELGPEAIEPRPRWLLRERPGQASALWLNFRTGFLALLGIYLLTGWGCLVMLFSWEFGWVNSFAKGYEQALIGPLTGLLGSALLIAALFYVPMARAHFAVTGDLRAFFQFRLVWRLIRTRLTGYVLLAGLTVFLAIVLEGLKSAPMFFYDFPPWRDLNNEELLAAYSTYLRWTALYLFLALLLTHGLTVRLYRSAVLKALHRGEISEADLHPVLRDWLGQLELLPRTIEERRGLPRRVLRWWYRRALFVALFLIWAVFVFKTYVGEFLQYHPFWGLMNHPTIQFPCVDWVPQHLR